jgi:hypothetical protein
MAVVGGIVASPAVQGVTGTGPADLNPPVGMSISSNGRGWALNPGESFVISALGVITTAVNLDWTQAGYFSFTTTSGNNATVTFGIGGSTGALSASLGQTIKVRITGAGTPTITWPATVTWVGTLDSTTGSSSSAPVVVNGKVIDVALVCTNTGSAPTFDGTFITG